MNKKTHHSYPPKTKKLPPHQASSSTFGQLKQISGTFQIVTFLFPFTDNNVKKY